jgi:hypothetical protein
MMQAYWTNFAKTGNPNGTQIVGPDHEPLMEWASHDGENWMQFTGNDNRSSGPVTRHNAGGLDGLEAGLMHHFKIVENMSGAHATPHMTAQDK